MPAHLSVGRAGRGSSSGRKLFGLRVTYPAMPRSSSSKVKSQELVFQRANTDMKFLTMSPHTSGDGTPASQYHRPSIRRRCHCFTVSPQRAISDDSSYATNMKSSQDGTVIPKSTCLLQMPSLHTDTDSKMDLWEAYDLLKGQSTMNLNQ
ncbi:hypothetical protein P152DRAFT_214344 [Eremomyces bilateralis CBS 781.70]|uniref:Uncharacterized protein n=1 Tax=Eremomyces bilateralis CBS 781.70 TaxID=1392243 RepID=A0A6G1FS45_9PEZI|nr:uncharacterized protein P152DRAFT_214344 [Eremomyces bilateralis CBS 781.70]KAF1808597.1 hypothetical protein P152DRAFT_214344 [Eremomyces bilateralis CBS 781.70]